MARPKPRRPLARSGALRWVEGARGVRLVVALAATMAATAGCRHVGRYVWVHEYKDPAAAAKPGYVISRGDSISVRVWNQETMSGRARVRSDGMISLPFVNDIEAAGLEPAALARRVQAKIKEFVVNPIVTVSLEEPAPLEVSVIGEVVHPGVFRVDQDANVLKALASAGGLTALAGRDRIFVLRYGDTSKGALEPVRIRFTYEALAHAEGPAAGFRLRAGDLVVVE